ncbi:TetR/AcrR family transcriptional regulator [Telmatospirillum sp.]|uniref:TetR/AcrR family transcriptional regulator n=1 Tax=Telmatospirillum sp. TaxID=2079197 RepID=UPI0028408D76|nr:TetR/AcrR family transcriptional regulator [Telmatospirillum sp.]MDR3438158.1 TetR/AcrR family transcriptional regulator [Telmatospirillum sp.]
MIDKADNISKEKTDKPQRTNNPELTKSDILQVATEEFAAYGFAGARVDAIAAKTKTTKRAIYYYFGSKEGLYIAVLEKAYSGIRDIESNMHLKELDAEQAVRKLVDFTIDYQDANPNFIRIVSIENIHFGKYVKESEGIRTMNARIIETTEAILMRGYKSGAFHNPMDPIDLHMMISAFSFFRVSNRHTFGAIFGRDLGAPEIREKHKKMIADMIIDFLKKPAASAV